MFPFIIYRSSHLPCRRDVEALLKKLGTPWAVIYMGTSRAQAEAYITENRLIAIEEDDAM